jgi:hypothetical protein
MRRTTSITPPRPNIVNSEKYLMLAEKSDSLESVAIR